jgi:hypothetical protein
MSDIRDELHRYFSQKKFFGEEGPIAALTRILSSGELAGPAFRSIVDEFGVGREQRFRKDVLDLVLGFVDHILEDSRLTIDELAAMEELKRFLDIREGEFLELRPVELAAVLGNQIDRILSDTAIDHAEELEQVNLQGLFGISYDQYLALIRRSLETAMSRLQSELHLAQQREDNESLQIQMKIAALQPLLGLALSQQRIPGARY